MTQEKLSNLFLQLRTDLERSLLYYAVMRARCSLWAFVVQSLSVVTASSVFVAVVGEASKPLMKTLAVAAAICSSLSIAERASNRADWYLQKRKAFSELRGRIPVNEESFTVELLEQLTRDRITLEADESPVYGCLSVLCHNNECMAVGMPEYMQPLTWWQRNVLRFFPVSYRRPNRRRCCLSSLFRVMMARKRRLSRTNLPPTDKEQTS